MTELARAESAAELQSMQVEETLCQISSARNAVEGVGRWPRVGVLIDRMSPGAVAKIAIEEVRNMRKLGVDARLVVLLEEKVSGYRYGDLLAELNVDWLSRNFPKLFQKSFRFPLFSFFSSFHVTSPMVAPKYVSRLEYDALIAHGTYTCFTAYRIWRARGIPYLAYIHDSISYILPRVHRNTLTWPLFIPLVHFGKFLDKTILEGSIRTIVNSKLTQQRVQPLSPHQPIEVIYPGCNPVPEIPAERGGYILAITKWDKGKKPDFLLDVMEAVPQARKLHVVGFWTDSHLRSSFLRQIKERGLQDRVAVLDPMEERDLESLYLHARCVMHPIAEAYGMSVLEAASCGCPSIIPRGSGSAELFKEGIHAFAPKEGDLASFASCLGLLAENERVAWQMGHEGWRLSKGHTWQSHAQKLIEAILKSI